MSLPVRLAALTLLILAALPARADWPTQPGSSALLAGEQFGQQSPSMAPDGDEGFYLVWEDARFGPNQVYVQRYDRHGRARWASGGVRVGPSDGYGVHPHVTTDGAGGALVAWIAAGLPKAQRFDPAGARLWGSAGVTLAITTGSGTPRIVADGTGGAFVVWVDSRSDAADLYAQRLSAAGTPQWTANGNPVMTGPGNQYYPRMVADGIGGVVVAWQDDRSGGYDVYVQRLSGSGAVWWDANGVRTTSTSGGTRFFGDGLASDGLGGAILTWSDYRLGNFDVYAQRINGAGSRVWAADGTPLCATVAQRTEPVAIPDGAGGAYFAWADSRAITYSSLYAQRMRPNGTRYWAADGVLVATPDQGMRSPNLIADGRRGAYVAWRDLNTTLGPRIMGGRLDGNGVSSWPAGITLGWSAFEVAVPAMVVSERGLVVAWSADLGNGADLFGQRMDAYGNLGSPEPRLVSVADVPNDQGGRVKVSWNASWLDLDPSWQVNYYTVLRSVPAFAATKRIAAGERAIASGEGAPQDGRLWTTRTASQDYYWEPIGSVNATHYVSGYSYLAPTAGDSVAGVNPRTAFMVVAQNYSGQFWRSAADSGYSVDDLAPAPPAPFTGNYGFGTMRLHWDPNAESDLSGYRLYRGDTPGFVPGPGNLIAAPADTGYSDPAYARYHYKLTAVDVHGNESPVATFSPSGTVGVDDVPTGALSFAAPTPNPARGATTLRFTLPTAGAATLEVYDASGRRVRTLHAGDAVAGAHAATFDLRDGDGRALPPGLYLARLEAGGRSLTRRLVIAH